MATDPITREEAIDLAQNVETIFYRALAETPVGINIPSLFLRLSGATIKDTIKLYYGVPGMREWLGDRRLNRLAGVQFSLAKKDWEASLVIDRDDLRFQPDVVRPGIEQLAAAYPRHIRDFAKDLFVGGFDSLAYDGQFFFDTDHDNGQGGTVSNKSTAVFSIAAWATAEAAMNTLVDPDSGIPLEIEWTDIYYGPGAQAAVDAVFNAQQHDSGGGVVLPNPHYNKIPKERQHKLTALGSSAKWFLTDESKPIKPLMLKIIKAVELIRKDNPSDWNMFSQKRAIYGIDSEDNAGYAFWELAYGGTAGE